MMVVVLYCALFLMNFLMIIIMGVDVWVLKNIQSKENQLRLKYHLPQ